jgi:adenine-specific DNA-methyltransferase
MNLQLDQLRTLRNASQIADLYHLLGYPSDPQHGEHLAEPEAFTAQTAQLEGAAAEPIQSVYILLDHQGLQHIHLESRDLSSPALRRVAENFLKRSGHYLLSFADPEYKKVIFVKPSRSEGAVRLSKLILEPTRPTRHDLQTLEAMKFAAHATGEVMHLKQIEAFNVERVTQVFFEVYKTLFGTVKSTLVAQNPYVQIGLLKKQTTADQEAVHAFTQRLLGRVIFLYFIQKKAWLDGQNDFLRKLYHQTVTQGGKNFYRDALEPLFFETLNSQRPDNSSAFGKIPYLNGSLFEREYPESTTLNLPNTLFDPKLEGSILGVFEHYSFTVEESSSLESDVSLDPEMLGKVFENLMEKGEAAESGTFYTPRSIVQFLSEESLARYLADHSGVSLERIRPLLAEGDQTHGLERDPARKIKKALEEVRVLDPAVGTASMLVGMLNTMIRVRRSVERVLGTTVQEGSATLADWKKEYINACLYGVDIKQEAIEIGRLRLWLSLVVDATEAEPLPNLDYKLMAGDGLLETIDGTPFIKPQEGLLGGVGQVAEHTKGIEQLHSRFYHEENPQRRRELRNEISALERELFRADIDHRIREIDAEISKARGKYHTVGASEKEKAKHIKRDTELSNHLGRLIEQKKMVWDEKEPLPFFLHNIHFAEVMQARGGFDIIIGNPPYVSITNMASDYKTALKRAFPEVESGRADLYVYFFQKALNLLRDGGRIAFITPNKYLKTDYGEKLRAFLEHTNVELVIDFGDLPIFDAAVLTSITILKKSKLKKSTVEVISEKNLKKYPKITQALALETNKKLAIRTELAMFHIWARKIIIPIKQSSLTKHGWNLENSEVSELLDKLRQIGKPLGEYINNKFYYGIKTGYNKAFIIQEEDRNELIRINPNSEEVIRPFLRGKDVRRWGVQWKGYYIILANRGFDIDKYSAIKLHLEKHRERLSSRATINSHPWYELQQPQEVYQKETSVNKIIYPDISQTPRFAYDLQGFFIDCTLFFIPNGSKYLNSLLNSNLLFFFLKNISPSILGGSFRYKTTYLEQLPIVIPNPAQQAQLESHTDDSRLPELNALVYEMYGLNAEEIALVELLTAAELAREVPS